MVTGGAGFIGSHVVDLIAARGDTAIVVDNLSKGRRENLPVDTDIRIVDITDSSATQALCAQLPDVAAIIHCAAQASVVRSTSDPIFDLTTNVAGTINILEIARAKACPLVFTSTGGAIYGEDAPRPTTEASPVDPGAPYGASKAAAEIYVRLWAKASDLPHAICRLANVYGPRQRGDGEAGVVAIFAERFASGSPITMFGDGEATRDYVHVQDVARALLDAVGTPGTVNISTGVETPVRYVLELVTEGVKTAAAAEVTTAPLREGELMHSCLDASLAHQRFGWVPEISVAVGIPSTANTLANN